MEVLCTVLEAIMLISFGVSWPFNLAKSIRTKSTKGKSPIFLSCICIGYIAGIIWKIVDVNFNWSTKWWVFALYVLNLIMVASDFVLYMINYNREKKLVIKEEK